MNVIDKLVNFEERKLLGYIEYDEDGSGTYYKFLKGNGYDYIIMFDKDGVITNAVSYWWGEITTVNAYFGSEILDFIMAQNFNFKYIDGWVKERYNNSGHDDSWLY